MSSKIKLIYYLLLSIVVLYTSSCRVTKQIPDDQSLLTENVINIEGVEKDLINDFFYKDELYAIPIQKPNKKTAGLKLSLGIWAFYNAKKVTQFTQFMKTKVGKEPILFDSTKLALSVNSFENYYNNIGYFDKKVRATHTTKNKKTLVIYTIVPNIPYKISYIHYDTLSPIEKIIYQNQELSKLEIGEIYNANSLKMERERIAELLNNKGYFTFNKEYVTFKLDSNKSKHDIAIFVKIAKESDSTDFEKYKLGRTYVLITNLAGDKKLTHPTIKVYDSLSFIQDSIKQYREDFLKDAFKSQNDSFYSKRLNTWTMQKLTDLNNFKLINSNFILKSKEHKVLDAYYTLTPNSKQSMSLGSYIYNSSIGLLGSSLALTYNNRNLTKRADRLNISLSGGLELNFSLQNTINNPSIISRSDISLNSKYTFEKFILPILFSNTANYNYYSTVLNNNFTFSRRVGYYDLYNTYVSAGYEWSKKSNFKNNYNPLSFNFIYIPYNSITTDFKATLARSPYLKSSFSNTFILGSSYIWAFNKISQDLKTKYGLKLNFETSGNSIYLIDKILNINQGNTISIGGVEVSQFVKVTSEATYSSKINKLSSYHLRWKAGAGLPYGNSSKLTYVKQFFIGGPYSLRAFQLRTIGPGSLNPNIYDTSGSLLPKDQLGNISLEANFEYRFNVIKFIKGAFFVDMGNIWNSSINFSTSDKAVFKFNEFYKQFYIGSGFGARFDFEYFVIRADMGVPIRVPYKDGESGWVVKDVQPLNSTWFKQNVIFNIAVGYPF